MGQMCDLHCVHAQHKNANVTKQKTLYAVIHLKRMLIIMLSFLLDTKYLLEILVTANVFLFVGVLQLVSLDVLPQGLDDAGAGLRVDAQQTRKPRVQLKLGWLQGKDKTLK